MPAMLKPRTASINAGRPAFGMIHSELPEWLADRRADNRATVETAGYFAPSFFGVAEVLVPVVPDLSADLSLEVVAGIGSNHTIDQ